MMKVKIKVDRPEYWGGKEEVEFEMDETISPQLFFEYNQEEKRYTLTQQRWYISGIGWVPRDKIKTPIQDANPEWGPVCP